ITVSTATNNATGYVLSATVGNGTHTNPTYNTTNITNKDNSSFAFSSLATNSSLANMSNSTDNTWGYSFSQDNGTNWTNYSGLPIYTATPKELISTNSNAGINIKFKIGAKASTDQPSGEYMNIINFVAVANATPIDDISQVTYMQDFNTLTSAQLTNVKSSMTEGTQYTLIDNRDSKTYTVSKLKDGNVWMTQNLDLDLDSTVTYTPSDTDISANWTPMRSTYTTSGVWEHSPSTPESYDPGNLYWNGTMSDSEEWETYYGSCSLNAGTLTCDETLNPLTTYTSSAGTTQYRLGNYYNWTAAVTTNDSSSYTTSGEVVGQSICPAGWTLPRAGTGSDSFYSLWSQYGIIDNVASEDNNPWLSPLYFSASGFYEQFTGEVGLSGSFWSSVVYSDTNVYFGLFYTDGYTNSSFNDNRYYGLSVRCVARPVSSTVTGV
ncbi:hypothetical protein IIY24_03055, partial [Candidatus Saccharibacteria bacterium]|nr:hypothetical protein [Candidatus Saccharibacteria bacterium]